MCSGDAQRPHQARQRVITDVPPFRSSIGEMLSMKWTVAILRTLLPSPARLSVLRRAIPGVSANVLASRLRYLEDVGIVERALLPEPADRQVYRLTERGAALRVVIDAMDGWSLAWGNQPAFLSVQETV